MTSNTQWISSVKDWGQKRLYGAPVAVVDVETTGLNPKKCRVVQIAIIHCNLGMNNAEVVYNELINPGCDIPAETTKIHGISNQMVSDKAILCDQLQRIKELLSGRIIAAYNLSYDFAVLKHEFIRHNEEWLPWFGICAKILAVYVDSSKQGRGYHRLTQVAKRRGLTFDAHNACEDALVTAKILDGLLGEASMKYGSKFGTVREYWSFQREQAIIQERGLRMYYNSRGRGGGSWPWTDW
jgi:DNA polymerase III epsilon subunit-like protein